MGGHYSDLMRFKFSEPFDLFLVLVPTGKVPDSWHGAQLVMSKRSFLGLNLSLKGARSLLAVLRAGRGNALVVPTQYRLSRIDKYAAQVGEERELARIRASSMDEYGPLTDGNDQGAWWAFYTDNITAQAKGMIPGVLCISVDKLDGHVASRKELDEFLEMSTL